MQTIQPKVVLNTGGVEPVHGVIITGGAYFDEDQFNPVISRPSQEWETSVTEESVCVNALWPSIPVTLNALEGASDQTVIVTPGQFRCTSGQSDAVTGVQRVFTNMSIELSRSTSLDYDAPTISEVDFRDNHDGSLTINVDAVDDSGIAKIVLLLIRDGEVVATTYDNLSAVNSYSLDVANFISDTKVVIQVVDGAGNVATWSAKGVNVRIIQVVAEGSSLYSPLAPTTFKGVIPAYNDVLRNSDSMFYRWAFGDGTYAFGRLAKDGMPTDNVTVEADGSAWFVVDHLYATNNNLVAELKVTDEFGGVGIDEVEMTACGDPIDPTGMYPNHDYVQCATTNNSTEVTITVKVAGVIEDGVQYRIALDYQGSAGDQNPDGKADVMLKYQNGASTGIKGLVVNQVGSSMLEFTFDLAGKGWKGNSIMWQAEVQDGIAGAAAAGFEDTMPDNGAFFYKLH